MNTGPNPKISGTSKDKNLLKSLTIGFYIVCLSVCPLA
jgi:hypothetical protein